MGGNDVCYNCGEPLNYFNYYHIGISKMDGPMTVKLTSIRSCENCIPFVSEKEKQNVVH